jgi:hypothetical protein
LPPGRQIGTTERLGDQRKLNALKKTKFIYSQDLIDRGQEEKNGKLQYTQEESLGAV